MAIFIIAISSPFFVSAESACPNLSRNLSLGSRGTDVVQLQNFLITQKNLATGGNSGYFGKVTEAAVKKFQCRKGITCNGNSATTGYGAVGAKTRTAIARSCSTVAYSQSTYGSSYAQGSYAGTYSQTSYSASYSQSSYMPPASPPPSYAQSAYYSESSYTPLPPPPPPPSDVVLSANGLMYKTTAPATGPHQYQVQWNPNNLYINNSGKPMVVKSLDVTFKARAGLGLAYADVCTVIMKDGDSGIANGIETLCFTEYKSAAAAEWDHPTVHVDFPGQGLWFPSGTYFVCGSQGISDASQSPPNYAADITCKATFAYADTANSKTPVQAIRSPYIDQRFTGIYSASTPHVNTSSVARPVLGVWTYLGTYASSIINCLGTKVGSGNWGQQCTSLDASATPNPMPLVMQNPGYAFNPSEQIGAQCTIQVGGNSRGSICASYFYISVPVVNGSFVPLERNATIPSSDAQAFCNSDSSQYAITDGSNASVCMSTLAH